MFYRDSEKHYIVALDDLLALVRVADLKPNITFTRQIRKFLTPGAGAPDDPDLPDFPRSEILLSNATDADIAFLDRVLDTAASDIYHDQDHISSRASIIPRLRITLLLEKNWRRTAAPSRYATHRRHNTRRAAATLAKHTIKVKTLVRRVLTDAYRWHDTHLEKEKWRAALISIKPHLARHILDFNPPDCANLRHIQTTVMITIAELQAHQKRDSTTATTLGTKRPAFPA